MATIAIFNNLKNIFPWQNKYMRNRGVFDIRDANLHHGDIRPFACPEVICDEEDDIGVYQSLYPLPSCRCLGFSDGRKVVKGFKYDEFYYIRGGYLRWASTNHLCEKQSMCRAGAPYNESSPVATSNCGQNCAAVTVSYVITYVVRSPAEGMFLEGAPSPPSYPVVISGSTPNVNVTWQDAPQGFCIVAVRLYRTETEFTSGDSVQQSGVGAEWVLVKEFTEEPEKGKTFFDNVSVSELGYPLLTYSPMSFPAPGNLVDLAKTTDCLAVAQKHRLYISVTGAPQFSWDGVVEIEDEIIAIEAIRNTIYVLTNHKPVKILYNFDKSGVLEIDKHVVERNLPLVSKRSVSVYRDSIVFASTYSLYQWTSVRFGEEIHSKFNVLLSPEQWKNVDPPTVRGTCFEYGYIFYSDGLPYSLMLEFAEDGVDTVQENHIMPITYIKPSAFAIDYRGHIIFCQKRKIYKWDYRRDVCPPFDPYDHVRKSVCGMCDCCPWSVKFYLDNEGKNHFSHMRVEWDERSAPSLDVSFHIHEFGREIKTSGKMEIISSRGFGLPFKNVSYQSCYAHLRGCGIVHEVKLATSAQELSYGTNAAVQGEE